MSKSMILVVEDNPVDYELLVGILGEQNYDFVGTETVDEGWQLAHTIGPSLIILDVIFLEGHDAGFRLCEKLKNDPSTKNIPVLIVTRRTLTMDLQEGERVGADGYLGKPYSPYELRQKVQGLLTK